MAWGWQPCRLQGHGERHGHAARAGGVCPQLGHTEQPGSLRLPLHETTAPQRRPGRGNQPGGWGGKRAAGAGCGARGSGRGPALRPAGSSSASALGKGLYLRVPAKPLQPPPYFFSPAAAPRVLGSIHGANLGREHPPVGTGRPVGAPHHCSLGAGHRRDPGVGAAWQGPGARGLGAAGAEQLRPRACTHRVLLQSDAAPGEREPDPPPRPWAPAERCPRDRGLGVARSALQKTQVRLLDPEPRRHRSQPASLLWLPSAHLGWTILQRDDAPYSYHQL